MPLYGRRTAIKLGVLLFCSSLPLILLSSIRRVSFARLSAPLFNQHSLPTLNPRRHPHQTHAFPKSPQPRLNMGSSNSTPISRAPKGRFIFVNLLASDLQASTSFYLALGGIKNELYSAADADSIIALSGSIKVTLMTRAMYQGQFEGVRELVDPSVYIQSMFCMTVEREEDVDRLCEIAEKNGGRKDPVVIPQLEGMYSRCLSDPDGTVSFRPLVLGALGCGARWECRGRMS